MQINTVLMMLFSKLLDTYIDLDISLWVYRCLLPLIIAFLLPFVFVALIYISFMVLFIYKNYR